MNENSQEDLCSDPLFVGLTRPATIWGIPYTAFVIEFMATTLIFLAVGNPVYLAIAVPIHGILYLICAADIGVFSSIVVWMQTIGRCQNSGFWGAASFSPLPKWKK